MQDDPRLDQLYFLRHHLQLVRSRGALELLDYAAAMDWAAEQELRARRVDGAVGREAERGALLAAALAELAPTMILSTKAIAALHAALGSAGEAPARLPIFGDAEEALEVLPAAVEVAPRFELLCPHCEAPIPRGRLDCTPCGRTIAVRAEPEDEPPAASMAPGGAAATDV